MSRGLDNRDGNRDRTAVDWAGHIQSCDAAFGIHTMTTLHAFSSSLRTPPPPTVFIGGRNRFSRTGLGFTVPNWPSYEWYCRWDSLPDHAEMDGGRVFSTSARNTYIHAGDFQGSRIGRRFAISHDDSSHAAAGTSAFSAVRFRPRQPLPKMAMVAQASTGRTLRLTRIPKSSKV